MKPVTCTVKHNPPESFGDCVRACVASILEMRAETVPHFADDGCNGDEMMNRIRDFLAPMGLAPVIVPFDGSASLSDLLLLWKMNSFESHAILFCRSGGSDHAVVMYDGRVVHNPAWYAGLIDGPTSSGFWHVLVLVRK